MKRVMQPVLAVLCLFGLAIAQAAGILEAIPNDALGFAVVHNLTETSRSIDEVAKLVRAPAPELLNRAKAMTGVQKGLDEHGDAAIVLLHGEPMPKYVVLAPVASFADLFAALQAAEPTTEIVEVQVAGAPTLVGRKGDYAVFAPATDRAALEQFLASTTTLANDESLAAWLDDRQASVVVTSHGIKEAVPRLTAGIRMAQEQLAGANGQAAADMLNLYVELFTAAETQVERFSLGLRFDGQSADLSKRVQFTPRSARAEWDVNANPAEKDLLAGLPAGPFVAAFGGAMDRLMKFSVQLMQN
jgi:hypothetical protein